MIGKAIIGTLVRKFSGGRVHVRRGPTNKHVQRARLAHRLFRSFRR